MPGEDNFITRRRKSIARAIREGVTPMENNGDYSTHIMSSGETGNKKYPYEVNPTIFPNEGGKSWTNLSEKQEEAYEEAKKRGEVFGFKSAKRAEKFGYGSWKEGEARKEAMKNYRSDKREGKLYTQSEEFKSRKKNR
jgi:hypothetical protein